MHDDDGTGSTSHVPCQPIRALCKIKQTTTFGTPGVTEHCFFLKEIPDAIKLRKAIVDRFERANMPSVPPDEKRRILSFVVVGGGVSGCLQ